MRVDDVEVLGRDPVQVRSLLRGAPDTKVVLRFLRKEMGETRGEVVKVCFHVLRACKMEKDSLI